MCTRSASVDSNVVAACPGRFLIEAVMFIVVVSVALVVVLKAFDIANQGSADPLLRRQALAIAQSLLDEISAKPFGDAASDDVAQDGYTPGRHQRQPRNGSTMSTTTTALTMDGIRSLRQYTRWPAWKTIRFMSMSVAAGVRHGACGRRRPASRSR
jgi:hypothetical protein